MRSPETLELGLPALWRLAASTDAVSSEFVLDMVEEARRERRDALERYGQHDGDCVLSCNEPRRSRPCTCGFSERLTSHLVPADDDRPAGARRGFFGVGIAQGKTEENLGGLWRSAQIFGADFVFTIGRRYPRRQSTDVLNSTQHVPLFEFATLEEFMASGLPRGARLVGLECSNVVREPVPLSSFRHPERAVYLLGSEDNGLSPAAQRACHELVVIPSALEHSLNVASSGTVVLYDREAKAASR